MARGLLDQIVELQRRLADLERRSRNRRRTGTVTEVDHQKGLARVKLSDKPKPYITPWIPWIEIAAGGTSTHIPPIVGEQVDVTSENGELTDAVIDFSIHSNKNPRPHDGPQAVIKHGDTVIVLDDDKASITTGTLTIKADVKIEGALDVVGERVTHNEHNIGDTHVHTQVVIGGDLSGPPP